MDGCIKCKPIKNIYDTIGITYYEITMGKYVLCYRHWYQANQPMFDKRGDHDHIFIKKAKRYEKL